MKLPFSILMPIVIVVLVLVLVVELVALLGVRSQIAVNATATVQADDPQTPPPGLNAIPTALAGPINCGQVSASSGTPPGAAAVDSALCFQFAFESCRPAQIALDDVNTGTIRTFATEQHGTRCSIVLTTQFSDASNGPAPAPIQCLGEAMRIDGLHVSGCNGKDDIVIPTVQPGADTIFN